MITTVTRPGRVRRRTVDLPGQRRVAALAGQFEEGTLSRSGRSGVSSRTHSPCSPSTRLTTVGSSGLPDQQMVGLRGHRQPASRSSCAARSGSSTPHQHLVLVETGPAPRPHRPAATAGPAR
ncbi:hypothetical protein ACFOOK_28440 [Micromonospora krabiensis]|uniref:hypothetical protein n=1 Tax=Micromonospora krabiensis TaxID=307121 RepID=UPI00360682FF